VSIATIIELIMGLLRFPKEVSALVLLLSKTPVEKHDEILKSIMDQQKYMENTGRPPEE
jgi:hypothetical protein